MDKCKTDYSVGSIHESNNYGAYEILGRAENSRTGKRRFHIRFLTTGYETDVQDSNIITGGIKDPYLKTVCGGVACEGIINEPYENYMKDYARWMGMLSRCYNPNDKVYPLYGGMGVTVCERWLCFENYYNDIKHLPGYEDYLKDPSSYQLDKDYMQQGVPKENQVYSPETCRFVHRQINENYRSNTGVNNTTGYYGTYKYHDDDHYRMQVRYDGKNTIMGVYPTPELAAGAYNCFVDYMCRNSGLPRNPVRTLTPYEMIELDMMTNKKEMCRVVDKDEST